MKVTHRGIEIDLEFDGDGFPLISINTGGNYSGDRHRPTVEIKLENVVIHDMFSSDDPDYRWEISDEEVKLARAAVGNEEYPVENIVAAERLYGHTNTPTLRQQLEELEGRTLTAGITGVDMVMLLAQIDQLKAVIAIRNHNLD
jgi:hypothetical protein